jgi:hypothetical protein
MPLDIGSRWFFVDSGMDSTEKRSPNEVIRTAVYRSNGVFIMFHVTIDRTTKIVKTISITIDTIHFNMEALLPTTHGTHNMCWSFSAGSGFFLYESQYHNLISELLAHNNFFHASVMSSLLNTLNKDAPWETMPMTTFIPTFLRLLTTMFSKAFDFQRDVEILTLSDHIHISSQIVHC